MRSHRQSESVKSRRKLCEYRVCIENLKCIENLTDVENSNGKIYISIIIKIKFWVSYRYEDKCICICGSTWQWRTVSFVGQCQQADSECIFKKSMWCIYQSAGSFQFQNSLYMSQIVAVLRRLIAQRWSANNSRSKDINYVTTNH